MLNRPSKINITGIEIKVFDSPFSSTIDILENEFNNSEYKIIFNNIADFQEGDVVIDIGANIGIITIYLAKKYPWLKIYAIEPDFENWRNLKRNLHINNINSDNVKIFRAAISAKNGLSKIYRNLGNSGASTISKDFNSIHNYGFKYKETVKTFGLDEFLKENKINNCKLLKIDCEGSEFDILYNSNLLNKFKYITGEVHKLDDKTRNREYLKKFLLQHFNEENIELT